MKRCLGAVLRPGRRGELRASWCEGTVLFLRGRSRELLRELARGDGARPRRRSATRRRRACATGSTAVERTVERQQIVGERAVDRDVFGWARRGGEVEVAVLHVRDGRRDRARRAHAFSEVVLDDGEVMGSFLGQYYAVPRRPVPARGAGRARARRRRRRARGAARRARGAPRRAARAAARPGARAASRWRTRTRRCARRSGSTRARASTRRSPSCRSELGLARLPRRIECYDVSTLRRHARRGEPRRVRGRASRDKNGYRRYRIREAAAGDDFACLREVLARRLAKRRERAAARSADRGRRQGPARRRGRGAARRGRRRSTRSASRRSATQEERRRRACGARADSRPSSCFLPARKDAVLLPPSSRGAAAAPARPRRGAPLRDRVPARAAPARAPDLDPRGDPGHRPEQAPRAAARARLAARGARGDRSSGWPR